VDGHPVVSQQTRERPAIRREREVEDMWFGISGGHWNLTDETNGPHVPEQNLTFAIRRDKSVSGWRND
jgi:hypothetical protein